MITNERSKDELLAAADEFFREPSALPPVPPAPARKEPAPVVRSAGEESAPGTSVAVGDSSGKDYLRELQQEFMQQEDEGKL
jgi:hypothetical protein